MSNNTTTKKTEENMITIGETKFTKDEVIKMGLLYIMILVIAFIV